MTDQVVEAFDISKAYGGIPVLRSVSLRMAPGTAIALAGENGAGKSTFLRILSGVERPDAGSIESGGLRSSALTTRQAREHGIALVPQELAPVPDMRVYENIFLGREMLRRGMLDRRGMIEHSRRLLEEFDLLVDPLAILRDLPVSVQQVIEIIKVLSTGSHTILLDEPTSAISHRESVNLFAILDRLKERGVSFLFTTHRMAEIRRVADRVVVLRDGILTLDREIGEVSDPEIINAMVGRELTTLFPPLQPPREEIALHVDGLIVDENPPIELQVRSGEILGIAGMVGAGRTELLEAIYGSRKNQGGTVSVSGHELRLGRVTESIKAGVGLVPEDRKKNGLVLPLSVVENVSLPSLADFSTAGVIRQRERLASVTQVMTSVRLKSSGMRQLVERLSGGNQQKVLLGRWLGRKNLRVLLLDEPTRGVDVGARSELYQLIAMAAEQGLAVLMVSSDMPEVLGLSHRILVMNEGRVAGELTREEMTATDAQDRVYRMASGYGDTAHAA